MSGERKFSTSCSLSNYVLIRNDGEKECKLSCPASHNYYIVDTLHNMNCLTECPQNTFILKIGAAPYECIESCPYYSYNDRECYLICPSNTFTIYDIKKCVDDCLDERGYKYYKNEKKCVKECYYFYPHFIPLDNLCTDLCPDNLPFISEDNTECIENCNGLLIDISINPFKAENCEK